MYAKFYAPALSHPGLENSMERRHKKLWLFQNCNNQLNCKPVPLSFGHCLLARLFKHPEFNMISSKSYEIMKVSSFSGVFFLQTLFARISCKFTFAKNISLP